MDVRYGTRLKCRQEDWSLSVRRILRVRWFHRVRNEDDLRRASITALTDIIATKRLRWFGHVSGMPEDRLPNYLFEWKPKHGKRSRGRHRKSLNGVFIEDAEQRLDRNGLTIDCMRKIGCRSKRMEKYYTPKLYNTK